MQCIPLRNKERKLFKKEDKIVKYFINQERATKTLQVHVVDDGVY